LKNQIQGPIPDLVKTGLSGWKLDSLCRNLEVIIAALISGDRKVVWNLKNAMVDRAVYGLMECATQAALVPTVVGALAMEAANKFMSIIAVAQWSFDENYEAALAYLGNTVPYDLAYVSPSDMIAYSTVSKSSPVVTEIVHKMEDGTKIQVVAPQNNGHSIIALTPGGTVLSYWNGDPDQIVTTMDWGAGRQTDIGSVCGLCGDRRFDPQKIDITDNERLVFSAAKCWEEETNYGTRTVFRDGIFTAWADGSDGRFIPIVLDETEYDVIRYDSFEARAVSVSGNGNLVVFSTYHDGEYCLYAVDASGGNLRKIASSQSGIDKIQENGVGDQIMFDYTNPSYQTELHLLSIQDGSQINLSAISDMSLFTESAAISPDGKWVACIGGTIGGDSENKYGIMFFKSDGSSPHFVDPTQYFIVPPSSSPLAFTRNAGSVVFSGVDVSVSQVNRQSDIFAIDVDPVDPGLRNLTNTPNVNEFYPVLGN